MQLEKRRRDRIAAIVAEKGPPEVERERRVRWAVSVMVWDLRGKMAPAWAAKVGPTIRASIAAVIMDRVVMALRQPEPRLPGTIVPDPVGPSWVILVAEPVEGLRAMLRRDWNPFDDAKAERFHEVAGRCIDAWLDYYEDDRSGEGAHRIVVEG